MFHVVEWVILDMLSKRWNWRDTRRLHNKGILDQENAYIKVLHHYIVNKDDDNNNEHDQTGNFDFIFDESMDTSIPTSTTATVTIIIQQWKRL